MDLLSKKLCSHWKWNITVSTLTWTDNHNIYDFEGLIDYVKYSHIFVKKGKNYLQKYLKEYTY